MLTMMGNVWYLCCCNKTTHSDETSSRENNCKVARIDSKEVPGATSQVTDPGSEMNRATPAEAVQSADFQWKVNPDTEKMDMAVDFSLDELITCINQDESSVMRGYLLARQRTGVVREVGQAPVAGAIQTNEMVHDFKREKFSQDNPCPGMSEVLEMIRDGVSLRHVRVNEAHPQMEAEESESNSQVGPELQRILQKRKVSSDNYISDGSTNRNPGELSVPYMLLVRQDGLALKNSPEQNYLCPDERNEQD